ncbi:hypothetical protein HanHA300_Chr13g0505461 [Helianthus annuus]|nr:hypothetical protein HanHA300_Chr13g0505461 [Helianthus annuus]KAJ0499742.1 hypothetical protein HanHA89_Chr13g0537321 [Helianthus annuus]KAJ0665819.1 hypothetical protein HanLR1_Chr13g0507931 [Helianthus annuus]
MLFGQEQRSILSSSSFSPKLTKFKQLDTTNFLIFTRTLLASSSDSHRYIISLHSSMLIFSTCPICSITPLQTSYVSPEIELIFNLVIDEAARTRLLNTPSPHLAIFKTLSEGSASAETSINSGQLFM